MSLAWPCPRVMHVAHMQAPAGQRSGQGLPNSEWTMFVIGHCVSAKELAVLPRESSASNSVPRPGIACRTGHSEDYWVGLNSLCPIGSTSSSGFLTTCTSP